MVVRRLLAVVRARWALLILTTAVSLGVAARGSMREKPYKPSTARPASLGSPG